MGLAERNDVLLLGGLAIALFAVFSRRLGLVLDYARQIDQGRGLQLLPAPVILAAVFVTASFGITVITPGELDAVAAIGRADAASCRAQEEGRNCVRMSDEETVVVEGS